MLPISLELKNFLAYRSPEPIPFEGIRVACLTGANGAGKSSLLDAITWALWGKARGSQDNELIHHGETDMLVQLDFEQDGQLYRVIRKRSRKGQGKSELDLFVHNEERGWVSLTESTKKATDEKITRLLKMSFEMFTHSAFLQQGKADAFTTLKPADRKRVLGEILELDRWSVYERRARDASNLLRDAIQRIDGMVAEQDAQLSQEPALRRDQSSASEAYALARAVLEKAEEAFRAVEHVPNALKAKQTEITAVQAAISRFEAELALIEREVAAAEARVQKLVTMTESREQIEAGYAQYQQARSENDALGELLQQVNTLQLSMREHEEAISRERAVLEQKIVRLDERIAQCQKTIAEGDEAQVETVRQKAFEVEAIEQQLKQAQEERIGLESEASGLNSDNRRMRSEMDVLQTRITRLEQEHSPVCPFCGQPLTEEHKLRMIEEWRREGTQIGDLFRANKSRIDEIGETQKVIGTRITALEERRKEADAARQQEALMSEALRKADKARADLAALEAEREPLVGALAAGSYASDARRRLSKAQQELDALRYDGAHHNEMRSQLEQYRQFEEQYRELQTALENLPSAQSILQRDQERAARQQKAIAEERQKLETLTIELHALQAQQIDFNTLRDQNERARLAEVEANNRVRDANQALKALEYVRERRAVLLQEREANQMQRVMLDELKEAFGRNGIPAMIIDTVTPELEESANRLLAAMTDGRMSLTLQTQREKVTGGLQETLMLQISDELGTRDYELYSGGEAFRINFALRIALSQLLARRANAHLRTLFIDEGFGTQDDDGRIKLVDAINRIQDQFDMILVITHIDELRDSFDVHLQVQKTPNGSQVLIR